MHFRYSFCTADKLLRPTTSHTTSSPTSTITGTSVSACAEEQGGGTVASAGIVKDATSEGSSSSGVDTRPTGGDLIYFKYDFGYEFGILNPAEDVKEPGRKLDEPLINLDKGKLF
jgi:hypothetical protein